jgi:5-methyltetrahydropteroyltriglutamate--homocysteine methyltransferase
MFTATSDLILPSTVTGSWPRPRWFDVSMWGESIDTCMMDVRFREKLQDALAVVISDEERAGLDILTHGDYHCDEDLAGRSWHHYPIQRWAGFAGDELQPEETRAPWLHYPPGTLLNEIYTGWRWPHVVDKIEHRPLGYPKLWRMAQAKTRKPVRFGTCCSQVMALFLDIHTSKYTDKRQVIWDMAEAMNKELLALRDAGCRLIQIEEPTFHFMANTFGKNHEEVLFLIEAFNREVQGLDDVELWIHTCWGNPNMQRVMEDTSYKASFELYLHEMRGDVWTIETKDRNFTDIELFGQY